MYEHSRNDDGFFIIVRWFTAAIFVLLQQDVKPVIFLRASVGNERRRDENT